MKYAKSGIAVLMALILLLSLAGCGSKNNKGEKTESVSAASDVRLPYSREDGVNPFTAQSLLNQPIMPLLYEGLYYVDASYKAQPEIASSSSYSAGELTVTLDGSHKFSDGTYISPSDVVYSFQKAKKSVYYGSALNMFSSARSSVGNSVIFKVASFSKYLTSDLVFPVVKMGSAEKSSTPVGSGQYKYRVSNMGGLLEKNSECKTIRTAEEKGNKKHRGSINKIYLSNIADTATLMDSLAIGNFNAVYDDLAAGPPERVKVNYGQMPMNDIIMVKLRTSGDLANAKLRQDISTLLDRDSLVNTGLSGYGIPAALPFNPQWYETKDFKVNKYNKDTAKSQLQKAFKGKTLSILTDGDNPLKVELATELQNQLLDMGIRTTIASPGYESYASAAGGDGYDFIIAEYKIPNDMNLSAAMPDKANLKLYQQVLTGQISLAKYAAWYQKKMPFLTLAYRNGLLAYSKDLANKPVPLPGNPYADAYQWEVD